MPLYEFQCEQGCGHFEVIRRWNEVDQVCCPTCKGSAKRLMSPVSSSFGWTLTEASHIKGNKDEWVKNI